MNYFLSLSLSDELLYVFSSATLSFFGIIFL